MLCSTKDLENVAIGATDGPIGHVKDFFFDDDAWVVRYLVVDTGSWLSGRRVLISPVAIRPGKWTKDTLPASLTMQQVKDSPDVESEQPLSRQNEIRYLDYYGYPNYWGGTSMWGDGLFPYAMMPGYIGDGASPLERERETAARRKADEARRRNDDPHLRSCKAIIGYRIHASDGEIGHVDSFLIDDETWAIRYLVVNTSNWWLGHLVLIAPEWITGASWSEETVSVDLSRESVKGAPRYAPDEPWEPEHEIGLYQHYARPGNPGPGVARSNPRADDR